jgi:hypothetical protein
MARGIQTATCTYIKTKYQARTSDMAILTECRDVFGV